MLAGKRQREGWRMRMAKWIRSGMFAQCPDKNKPSEEVFCCLPGGIESERVERRSHAIGKGLE